MTKFIDGVLAPRTIKNGVYVHDGLAYFILGSFVTHLTTNIVGDIAGVKVWQV